MKIKKHIVLFACCQLMIVNCFAHPGIGIVKDSHGNIYYTDLKQIWKVTSDGDKKIVVPNVHSHELYMDKNDNLYGEHLWYNGEQLKTWGHYAWCLQNNGELVKEIEPAEGFLSNYSFVRDTAGNMYWVERFTVSRFKKKTKEGVIITIAEGKFKDVRWMYATPKGEVYFIDLIDLYKIDLNGQCHLLAKNIAEHTAGFGGLGGDKHSMFGIWTDNMDNVYVANYSGQRVKQINATGMIKNIVYSTSPWSPTGGIFDEAGNLWLLENSMANQVRVRKINKDDLGKTN